MKYFLSFIVLIIFLGCSGGEAKTEGSVISKESYDKRVVMYTNETREIELELDLENSYQIVSSTQRSADKVSHYIKYIANSTRPYLELKGLSAGEEVVTAKSTSAGGESKEVKVSVLVVNGDGSDIVLGASIDANGTVPTDGNTSSGGTTVDPTTPPVIAPTQQILFDRNACLEASPDWKKLEDDYKDTEGHVSSDKLAFIKSVIITNHVSTVKLYYPAITGYSTPVRTYSLGRYSYTTKEGVLLLYDVELAVDMVGKKDYFYVKSNNYCLRMKIPSSTFTPPDKTVTWVGGTN